MAIQHSDLTGALLHEPKGSSASGSSLTAFDSAANAYLMVTGNTSDLFRINTSDYEIVYNSPGNRFSQRFVVANSDAEGWLVEASDGTNLMYVNTSDSAIYLGDTAQGYDVVLSGISTARFVNRSSAPLLGNTLWATDGELHWRTGSVQITRDGRVNLVTSTDTIDIGIGDAGVTLYSDSPYGTDTDPAILLATTATASRGEYFENASVEVTAATTTTVWGKNVPNNHDAIRVEVRGVANDGSDAAAYGKVAAFRRDGAGTLTQIGSTQDLHTDIEGDATWDLAIDNSGTDIRVRATPDGTNNTTFTVSVRYQYNNDT